MSNNKIFLGIAAVMLGLPPLLQGFFFDTQQYLFCLVTFALIIAVMLVLIYQKEQLQLNSLLDYALPLFILVYLVSSFFAVSTKIAAVEVLKYINYLFVFILVRYLSQEERNIKKLLSIIFSATVLVAIIGLGAAMNLIPYSGAYSQTDHWIIATMLDHNVFAILCLVGILLGYGLYLQAEVNWQRLIYAIGGFLLTMGAMSASALSAWIVFPIALLAFIIMACRRWTRIVAYSLFIIMPYMACANKFGTSMVEQDLWGMLGGLLIGLLLTIVLAYIAENLRKINYDIRKIFGYIGIVLIALAIIIIAIFPSTILPSNTAKEFSSTEPFIEMVAERSAFYQDSFALIKTSTIIGSGGNAWSVTYPTYQSSSNVSEQVQSYMMQVWLETGMIGLILLIVVMLAFFYCSFLAIRKYKILGITVACSALLLLLHSFIDATFSFTSVSILFWALLGMIAVMSNIDKIKMKINPYYFIGVAVLSLIVCIMFLVGRQYSLAGNEAVSRADYAGASTVFGEAIQWNPLDDESRLSYIYAKLFMLSKGEKQEPGFVDQFNNTMRLVLERGERNVPIIAASEVLYQYTSQTLEAVTVAERLVEVQPLLAENYETLVRAYVDRSNELLQKGDKEGAKTFLNYIIEVPNVIDRLTSTKAEKVKPTINTLLTIQRANVALQQLQ